MKHLSLLAVLLLISISVKSQIVFSEIMYNPPEAGADTLEFLELYNTSPSAVDLSGWSFSAGLTMVFEEGVIIDAGEYLTLCINKNAFQAVYGDTIRVIQWQARALVNGGELLTLVDNQGKIVYSVDYKSGGNGWYSEADGRGASIELCNFSADPNLKESWRPSENALGVIINNFELLATPGRVNSTICDGAINIEIEDFFFSPDSIVVQVGQKIRWINSTGSAHNINGSQSEFPDNPISFGNGEPSSTSWEYEFFFEQEGRYTYQSDLYAESQNMKGIIIVGEPDVYQNVNLEQIRQNTNEGTPQLLAQKVRVEGVVHTPNLRPSGLEFFILNPSNVGVSIFHPSSSFGYEVIEGDFVIVEGRVDQFRGLTQIVVEGIQLISSGNELVQPRIVETLTELEEGSLVQFRGVLQDESLWTNTGSGFNVNWINPNTGQSIIVRILSSTEIFGNSPISLWEGVTGIGSQFTNNPPFNSGYQLIPRYLSDFLLFLSTTEAPQIIKTIFPNPTRESINVELLQFGKYEYSLINSEGLLIGNDKGNSDFFRLDVSSLPAGIYLLIVQQEDSISRAKILVN
jgi:plastocyanin/DNA/RNA endonuclease YhcR with UshA esterase domain